jgi:hypothetical protein
MEKIQLKNSESNIFPIFFFQKLSKRNFAMFRMRTIVFTTVVFFWISRGPPEQARDNQISENDVYIDVGTLFWSPNDIIDNNGVINWNADPPQIVWNSMLSTFSPLFQTITAAGSKKVYLSFAQIGTIPILVYGGTPPSASADRISQVNNSYNYPIVGITPSPGVGLITALIAVGRQFGVQSIISFGGAAASSSDDWIFNSTMSVTSQANALMQWAASNQISGFDFDIENSVIWQNDPNSLTTFFSTLAANPQFQLTIALLGAPDSRSLNLVPYFKRINLMLYSSANGPQYVTGAWLQQWLNYPQIQGNAGLLSVGFDVDTMYENPNPETSGGSCGQNPDGSYTCASIPSGSSRGTSAFLTFDQASGNVSKVISQFGPTFWWADYPQNFLDPTKANSVTLKDFWTSQFQATE